MPKLNRTARGVPMREHASMPLPPIAVRPDDPAPRLRALAVDSGVLVPLFADGDFVLIAPCSAYVGAGLYVLVSETHDGRTIMHAERQGDTGVRLSAGSTVAVISRTRFSGLVMGKVVARVSPLDLPLFRKHFFA